MEMNYCMQCGTRLHLKHHHFEGEVPYCDTCGELIVSETAPEKCPKCGETHLRQDEDVLDTWFSSALWPFSTLGWPEETEDLKYFYPTDVLVTGYDIIFFWVVRMVFSALETTGEVPFHDVYVHGLVRDAQGRKMSKSLGNGIDPLEIIDQYGADALRFMLTTGITPGNDMRFKTDRLEAARNFANKLWNASRFVIMNLEDAGELTEPDPAALRDEDKWMLSRLNDAVKYVTETMEKYDLALAGQRVYDLIWNEYCDWYIELVKKRLYGEDEADKQVARYVLVSVLKEMLTLLHPFMPFITEEIWGYLPGGDPESMDPDDFLIHGKWPEYDEARTFPQEAQILQMAMEIIRSIRNIRAEAEAAPGKKLHGLILPGEGKEEICRAAGPYISNLANLSDLQYIGDKSQVPEEVMSAVVDGAEIFVPLDDLMDYDFQMMDPLLAEKHADELLRLLYSVQDHSNADMKEIIEDETQYVKDVLSKNINGQQRYLNRLNEIRKDSLPLSGVYRFECSMLVSECESKIRNHLIMNLI